MGGPIWQTKNTRPLKRDSPINFRHSDPHVSSDSSGIDELPVPRIFQRETPEYRIRRIDTGRKEVAARGPAGTRKPAKPRARVGRVDGGSWTFG